MKKDDNKEEGANDAVSRRINSPGSQGVAPHDEDETLRDEEFSRRFLVTLGCLGVTIIHDLILSHIITYDMETVRDRKLDAIEEWNQMLQVRSKYVIIKYVLDGVVVILGVMLLWWFRPRPV